jgi:hypothetical protein
VGVWLFRSRSVSHVPCRRNEIAGRYHQTILGIPPDSSKEELRRTVQFCSSPDARCILVHHPRLLDPRRSRLDQDGNRPADGFHHFLFCRPSGLRESLLVAVAAFFLTAAIAPASVPDDSLAVSRSLSDEIFRDPVHVIYFDLTEALSPGITMDGLSRETGAGDSGATEEALPEPNLRVRMAGHFRIGDAFSAGWPAGKSWSVAAWLSAVDPERNHLAFTATLAAPYSPQSLC